MVRFGVGVAIASALLGAGCGHGRAAGEPKPRADALDRAERRYVDQSAGFEVTRPRGRWEVKPRGDLASDGMATPVLLKNVETGTQVVVQVAPATSTPAQLAERLTTDLREREGFTATDPEPLPFSESAVGFGFTVGRQVVGRVAVMEAAEGRVFMLLATWPADAKGGSEGVEEIFRSVRPVPPS